MNMSLFSIILAITASMTLCTLMVLFGCYRLNRELENARSELKEKNKEIGNLESKLSDTLKQMSEMSCSLKKDGISEETVLAIVGEMNRMENNVSRMQDVPGRKQIVKALQRVNASLQTEGYTIVPLMGKPYSEGMMVEASFVYDDELPPGTSVITMVKTPQVNHNGMMIQAGRVTVTQNI